MLKFSAPFFNVMLASSTKGLILEKEGNRNRALMAERVGRNSLDSRLSSEFF